MVHKYHSCPHTCYSSVFCSTYDFGSPCSLQTKRTQKHKKQHTAAFGEHSSCLLQVPSTTVIDCFPGVRYHCSFRRNKGTGSDYLCCVESFFKNAEQLVKLSTEAREALASSLSYHEVSKGHLLVKPHSICNYLYFVEKGLTRTFYYKVDKDITDWLSPENNFACSIVSFINRIPDRRGIEVLEDSILWSLEHSKLEGLYQSFHEIERLGRLIISSGMTLMQKRFDDLHFASALERYDTLMQTYPTLLQRAPLGHIASYLGITQETLSRIRAQKNVTSH